MTQNPVSSRDGFFAFPKHNAKITIKLKRNAAAIAQEQLADQAGLSSRYIGAIERADVSANVTVPGQIAVALGIEAVELLKRPE
jgi:transcriptional regulator with XRE-family HTH domain